MRKPPASQLAAGLGAAGEGVQRVVVAVDVVLDGGALALVLVRVVVDVHRHRAYLLRPRLVPELFEEHLRQIGSAWPLAHRTV